jgi:peptide/nickel transport system substrate-binding protein
MEDLEQDQLETSAPPEPTITPAPEISSPDTAPPVTSSPEPVSGNSAVQAPKRHGRKLGLAGLIIIVLALAGAAIVYSVKPHNSKVATTKKDIPYLSYGDATADDLSASYPVETSDTSTTTLLYAQLFEGLVRYQDQTKIIPLLATSWSNPNDSTWVFNLRHNVKFHSGRTMTATDVKYSLDYAVAHQSDNDNSTNLALASTIAQVDVVNPYQIRITTNGPDPVLLNRLTYLYIIDSKAKLGDFDAGTGPYIVKPTSKPAQKSIDLTATNDYWGGHVYTRALHLQSVPNINQLTADTTNGKYAIAGDFTAQQLATIKHYQPIIVPDLGVTFLGLNTLKAGSPLESLAARQAITYALNVPAILKAGGLQGTPANQLIPPAIPGYDSSVPNTPYNPAKAKALLATVKGASAPLTLSYPADDDKQLAEIGKELNAVGFNVKLSSVASLSDLVNQAIGGQTDMFYLSYTSNTLDGLDIIDSTIEGTQDYSNSELDSLTKQASSTIDPAARIAILQKIEQLVHSNVPAVPLYSLTRTFALTKSYVTNVDMPSTGTGTYFWQVYQK